MKKVIVTIGFATLTACATNPDNIDAAYVSPLQYSGYNCNQLGQEMGYLEQRTNVLYQSLKDKRSADNWQMGVGLLLFWPTLFALEGGDGPEATEYAQIKGEYEALRINSVEKSCNLALRSPDQILDAARTADENVVAPTQVESGSLTTRLQELDRLKAEGLINEEEYQAARRRALEL